MMNELKVLNVFGITPTKNYEAAGYDFYIPNIPVKLTKKEEKVLFEAFQKSYGWSKDEIDEIAKNIILNVNALYDNKHADQIYNMLQLFGSLNVFDKMNIDDAVEFFVDNYLVFDNNGTPGINVYALDHVKFNSGIKLALEPGYAGVFFNKSGRGSKGWDVRACVVDEDYRGYVHTSLSFTAGEYTTIYCGDKLVQMLILEIPKTKVRELTEDEFNKLSETSKRGDSGFGSSNEKH